MKKVVFSLILLNLFHQLSFAWGFFAHQRINRLAVFTLPPEMIRFYKYYIVYLTENAVNPDRRRYAIEGEAERHFIDADVYDKRYGGKGEAVKKLPRSWKDAVAELTEDTLKTYGIVPWHIVKIKQRLTNAFKNKDTKEILRLSADLGHYIGDANVPLHTTENYNGQLTGQKGIHSLWESRLPELFFDQYDFFVGKAEYIQDVEAKAWEAVMNAHAALDSVLDFERILTKRFPEDKKYTLEERGGIIVRTYSRPFSKAYHEMLNGQVERRLRASIKMVGDFWYTCWVDAGQPNLNELIDKKYQDELQKEVEENEKEWQIGKIKARPHESMLKDYPFEELKASTNSHACCYRNPYLAYYQRKLKNDKKNNLLK
ncbi:MAG: zinc dependent phospholipase C family protein [Microscillaceae bacterium]|nr:zinc dependent phospholipase C family protein [Microscillaceae bacterium]MDW8460656.1 zinc dependent phospholipase C family protein [Cytophagales bacterium]